MRRVGQRLVAILGSFRFAVLLLGLLWILTLIGTFAQRDTSLFLVQERIFGSAFFLHEVGGIPIPLPGAYLVLALLLVNLVVGGMLRMRKGRSTWGILLTHIGIAVLLVGGFVEDRWSTKGRMTLYEGDTADTFVSYHEWEVVVAERLPGERRREYVVPHEVLAGATSGARTRVAHAALPFDLVLRAYLPNADVRRAEKDEAGIDGYVLVPRPREPEAETDIAGLHVELLPKDDQAPRTALLWALQGAPFQTEMGGRRFELDLRRRSWPLPFRIRLTRFEHAMHPGTGIPSRFSSYVSRVQEGVVQDAHITMNEPLRHAGYTLYQSGWGPEDAGPGERLYSTFSVVRNPSDRIPLVACVVIAAGLIWHFGRRLVLHLRAQAERIRGEAA